MQPDLPFSNEKFVIATVTGDCLTPISKHGCVTIKKVYLM